MPKTRKRKLKEKADSIYSQFVRRSHADWRGNVTCYTCGKLAHWKRMHNGHFVRRNVSLLRYDERNTRPQCPGCNLYGGGRLHVFADKLMEELGDKEFKKLLKESRDTNRSGVSEKFLEDIIEKYAEKLKELDHE